MYGSVLARTWTWQRIHSKVRFPPFVCTVCASRRVLLAVSFLPSIRLRYTLAATWTFTWRTPESHEGTRNRPMILRKARGLNLSYSREVSLGKLFLANDLKGLKGGDDNAKKLVEVVDNVIDIYHMRFSISIHFLVIKELI